ncbi:hypothetical protein B0H16DRAFT_1741910 [Mycena metata]|uniref:CxC2-like cysteine cluster KDZ transposase-associated domain-containing protein n=1 Tax=Mycena metata TaxID=1033252 RepID=A0AAD7H9T4_9AGAR|nr:hypothetical protein B0H16DRAFT_1741910 [Mycena metata]
MTDATRKGLTEEEDRAFKRLALDGAPLDGGLRNWVDRYVPAKTKRAGYVAGAAVRERVVARALAAARERPALEEKAFMRHSLGIPINPRPKPAGYVPGAAVRARVAARRERVETFMALCKPRARHPGFVRLGPLSEPVLSRAAREKAAKAAKRKATADAYAQRRREEAAANVAELIQLRLAGEQRKKKDGEHEKERLTANRPTTCETCKIKTNTLYRCRNCFWPRIICRKCLLAAHAEHPLHRVEDVPASHGYTLSAMGLVVFLGHSGAKCPEVVIDTDFTVLGVDGAHDVTMGFCGCDGGLTRGQQLEAMRLHGWRSKWRGTGKSWG